MKGNSIQKSLRQGIRNQARPAILKRQRNQLVDEQQTQLSNRLERLAADTTAQINTLGETTGTQITKQQQALKEAGEKLDKLSGKIRQLHTWKGEIDEWRSAVNTFQETQENMNREVYGKLGYLTNYT